MKSTIRSWLCLVLALAMALTAAVLPALAAEPVSGDVVPAGESAAVPETPSEDPAAPAGADDTEELPVEKPSEVVLTRVEIEMPTPEYNSVYFDENGGGIFQEDGNNTWAWVRTDGADVVKSVWNDSHGMAPTRFSSGSYFAEINLEAQPGYRFPDSEKDLRLIVNGITYAADTLDYYFDGAYKCFVSTYKHPTTMTDISQLKVDLPLPVAGGSHHFVSGGNGADASTIPGIGDGAWIYSANWYDDSLSDPETFSTYQAGKTYRARVVVYGETGHGFPAGTAFWINGTKVGPPLSQGVWQVQLDPYYYTVPAATPAIQSIANTVNGVHLVWTESAGAVKYAIYRKASTESKYTRISVSSTISYTDRSAVDGTYYYYRIWGMNASNKVIGEWSNARGITCQRNATPAITSIANTINGVQINWGSVPGVAKYAIYRKAQGESKYTRISISTTTGYIDRSAVNGTYYYYRIWSMNSSNVVLGEWSNARGITCVKSVTPTIASISSTVFGVRLTWGAVPGVAKYAIYRKASGESKYTRISISTATSYTDKSAQEGTYYYYRIWSMDSSNKVLGEWSTARGTTFQPPQ